MHVLSHQLERVRAASSGDYSTEHSRFAALPLPCRFRWKMAFRGVWYKRYREYPGVNLRYGMAFDVTV